MKKYLIIGLVGLVALFVVGKKTNVFSYASTLVASVEAGAKDQVPTKFELERIRHEIKNLDGDISQMVRPIAEHRVVVEKMRKDIAKSQANIDEQKKKYLEIIEELEAGKKNFTVAGRKLTRDQVDNQLRRDMDHLKVMEKNVKTQHQLLEAKEAALKGTQEQLAKVVTKKREYEVRLAELEAQAEQVEVAKIGSDLKIDSSRATQIESSLQALEQRINTEMTEARLRTGEFANINLLERDAEPVDLSVIRSYLQGTEPSEKAASNR